MLVIGGKEGEPNYPGSPYKSGDILEVVDYFILIDDICSKLIYNEVTNAYPELFRPLQWWEYRKPEEMPEYVTVKLLDSTQTGTVYRLNVDFKYNYHNGVYLGIQYVYGGGTLGEYLLPATEQEYWDSKPLLTCPDCGSTWKKADDRCPECFPI